ncbi:MAG: hypothetical protein KatS3mg068_1493 [Candidatus Sericytochromatia bacterium]|nr:MAG: hypothetical protein KatS3mg068_1493 [Candidatus Sericytochromatia bacterium]
MAKSYSFLEGDSIENIESVEQKQDKLEDKKISNKGDKEMGSKNEKTENKIKIFNRTNEDIEVTLGSKKLTFKKLGYTEISDKDYESLMKEEIFSFYRGRLLIKN